MRAGVLKQMSADKQYVRELANLLGAQVRHVTTHRMALHLLSHL